MRGHSLLYVRTNDHLPHEAEIVHRVQESRTVFSLYLRFTDPKVHEEFVYTPGQFTMLYLHGAGEVPISIVSDPEQEDLLMHTINRVGRVTRGLSELGPGARLGVRGPFGRGWPLRAAEGQDVVVVSGGLGCAPAVCVINHLMHRRERYGRMTIVQKVKRVDEFIWPDRYERWTAVPDTTVLVASTQGAQDWRWQVSGRLAVIDDVRITSPRTIAFLCGPAGFMASAARHLIDKGVAPTSIYLSTERNMQCGVGLCGHCQFGGSFICREGPIFDYPRLAPLLDVEGF